MAFTTINQCGFLLFSLLLITGSASAASNRASPRQAGPTGPAEVAASSSALAPAISQVANLPQILVPAIRTLFAGPLHILHQLLSDLAHFLATHKLVDILNLRLLRQVLARIPDRAFAYYETLLEMESACMHRTLCDMSSLLSLRSPKWISQAALIYLNTFAEGRPHYDVMINGVTTHKCAALYPDCDPQQFVGRLRGNLSESIGATVAPVQVAFDQLVAVTASTLDLLTNENQDSQAGPRPSPVANNNNRRPLPMPVPRPRPMNDPSGEDAF